MILIYCFFGTIVLITNASAIPSAFALVFHDAFTGTAAIGGFWGQLPRWPPQKGMSRGVFFNESGLGTGGIAAASARLLHPVRQGLVSMTQTFIDMIIVVSFTGIVIITTGAWKTGETGLDMTAIGFDHTFFWKCW